jgi:uncharacterized repeat protein (TIGR01451 family)
VEGYGGWDDHDKQNVPLLIEDLAGAMQTCMKGTTYIDDMQAALDQWFNDTGLSATFTETTYDAPDFLFIEDEIERSQDVILLLGDYNLVKAVDQQQTVWTSYVDLPIWSPGHLQSFRPSVDWIDAVQLLLSANNPGVPTDVKVCIYDKIPFPGVTPLGCCTMTITPPPFATPVWFQFHFEPSIGLIPNRDYYISAEELTYTYNVHWHFENDTTDHYLLGTAFYQIGAQTFQVLSDQDFCFKTEYYDGWERMNGHYVTCAGVNSPEFKIAVSDPCRDVANPAATDHNDAANVSHDIYDVAIGCPPFISLPYQWWLPGYPSNYTYTIVEQAVIICPKAVVEIEKKVWDPVGQAWTEEIDEDLGNSVRFNITVHNPGGYPLSNISVHDVLPDCLSYADNAVPKEPDYINGLHLYWNFTGPLEYCESISIEFDATVVSDGENINTAIISADTVEGNVTDTDTATVNGIAPLPTVDTIVIAYATENPIPDVNISTNTTLAGYAFGYNATAGSLGLVSVNWSVSNSSSNASTHPAVGTSSTLNSGWHDGTASWIIDYGNNITDVVLFHINHSIFCMPLHPGWNLLGWFSDTPTTAKSILENVTGCVVVYWYDAETSTPKIVTPYSPPDTDFPIRKGMGMFVAVSVESFWYGEG